MPKKVELTAQIIEWMYDHIQARGGITDYPTLCKLYSTELVDKWLASSGCPVTTQTITVKSKANEYPPHPVKFIISDTWDGKQPEWYHADSR
jgi:hypothetical protein